MFACFFAFIEIISCAIDSPQPTAQVEVVKSVSPADASVQVVVDHGLLKSRFSGTAIAPNLVVTCWHGFRDKGSVSVNGNPAKLLRFDAVSDVALVETSETLASVPVASKPLAKGETATAFGYEYNRNGLWKFPTKITAINRYSGFPNQSILGRPNQGRSGGGLFNEAGELIGVCSAADGNEGLYCGLEAVTRILSQQPPLVKETLPVVKQSLTVQPVRNNAIDFLQDCPDGKCPLVKRLPPSTGVIPAYTTGNFNNRTAGPLPQGKLSLGGCSPVGNSGHLLQPTLAPPEPMPYPVYEAKPLRSVMIQPVRRAFQWRPFNRLFGRR